MANLLIGIDTCKDVRYSSCIILPDYKASILINELRKILPKKTFKDHDKIGHNQAIQLNNLFNKDGITKKNFLFFEHKYNPRNYNQMIYGQADTEKAYYQQEVPKKIAENIKPAILKNCKPGDNILIELDCGDFKSKRVEEQKFLDTLKNILNLPFERKHHIETKSTKDTISLEIADKALGHWFTHNKEFNLGYPDSIKI
ncbi:hypothetical protein J4404_02245 [Candidatus Woesearchaeota archaeon]|nr:hypothetical protein [Candidatus Woesearchaeota archaeon]